MFPSTTMLNQGLMLVDQGSVGNSSHMASFCTQETSPLSNLGFLPYGCQQQTLTAPTNPSPVGGGGGASSSQLRESTSTSTMNSKLGGALVGERTEAPPLVQISSNGMWPWVEEGDPSNSSRRPSTTTWEEKHNKKNINNNNGKSNLSVAGAKMKKVKARRKVREPRFCFKTMSDVDVLDDGYKWRKYGQKVVKNTQHPRSYYRCTQDNCRVKKRVERLAEDPRMVITTYEGRHAHSPSHDGDEPQNQSQINFFW